MNEQKKPFLDSYWVTEQLVAGEYPATKHELESREKLQSCLDVGIDFFIDLTEEGELVPYNGILKALDSSIGYERMSIRDMDITSVAHMEQILQRIDQLNQTGKRVFVHCWGGIGRTGTVVGCYMVRHGMSGEDALRRIADLRRGTPDGDQSSPQTKKQVQMVLDWGS